MPLIDGVSRRPSDSKVVVKYDFATSHALRDMYCDAFDGILVSKLFEGKYGDDDGHDWPQARHMSATKASDCRLL